MTASGEHGTQPAPMTPFKLRLLRYILGISIGIGLLVLLNQLQIPYYLYYPQTTHTILISDLGDFYFFIISSLSVPCTLYLSSKKLSKSAIIGVALVWAVSLTLTFFNEPFTVIILYVTVVAAAALATVRGESRRLVVADILSGTLGILVLVECPAVLYWASAALNPQQRVGLLSEQVEANLTYSLYPIAIPMLLLLLFSWLWIPILTRYLRTKSHFIVRYQPSTSKWDRRSIAGSLDLIGVISVLIFFYSYLAGQSWVVGVDSHLRYLDPLTQLNSLTASQAVYTSYTHGAYLVALYAIQLGIGISSFTVVKYMPLVLTFMTASAVLFAARSGGWKLEQALLSAISASVWFPTSLGIYAGIQANWVALLFWMLFLSIYFLKRNWGTLTYAALGLLSLAILLVHPWTWGVFIATLALTVLIMRRSAWERNCIRGLFAALIISVPVGLIAYSLLPGLGSDFTKTIQLYSLTLRNPLSLYTFTGALLELFTNWGAFLSPILLMISLVGASTLFRRQGLIANYLIAWTTIWCVGSILVAPVGYNPVNTGISETGIWRMLYVSPLPFLLALGLQRLLQLSKHEDTVLQTGPREHVPLPLLPAFSIAAILAVSGGLFLTWDPAFRLLLVMCALTLSMLLIFRSPRYQGFQILLGLLLGLVLLNAVLRSLFPLLLDPHNLFSTGPLPTK